MTKELSLQSTCNHRIVETIQIQGTYPDTFAVLSYKANQDKTQVKIFEVSRTSELEMYNYKGTGCTNWEFSGEDTIRFNVKPNDTTYIPNNNPNLNPQEVWIAVYSSILSSCPKCNGKKKDSEISVDGLKRVRTLSGADKVRQEIIKIILTVRGSSIFDTNYGTTLSSSIGKKLTDSTVSEMLFSLTTALEYLMSIQEANNVPDNEQITGISQLDFEKDATDIRKIWCHIKVVLASYEEVSVGMQLDLNN